MNNVNWRNLWIVFTHVGKYQTNNIVTVVFVSLNISMHSKKAFDEF